ncbi:MHF histone-fold complex component [Amphichorda felina]
MADTTQEEDLDRLKAALWYAVGQMVDEESLKRNRNATPQFIGALTELVWTQIGIFDSSSSSSLFLLQEPVPVCDMANRDLCRAENVAIDLESFSGHAGRTTVTTDDVLLLARKNPDLHQLMEEFIDARKAAGATAGGPGKGKGRARK